MQLIALPNRNNGSVWLRCLRFQHVVYRNLTDKKFQPSWQEAERVLAVGKGEVHEICQCDNQTL